MSSKERRRLMEFSRVKDGLISVAEAARSLGLSERQGRRVWRRYCEVGDGGVVHGLRGKPSNARKVALREKALGLYRRKYQGFNVAHAAELMGMEPGELKVEVARGTLWRWLKAEHLVVGGRRTNPHRQRRERRSCCGELIQMDGSEHPWLGEDGERCVLFEMVDDATGETFARFYPTEDTPAAMDLFGRYVRGKGVPRALYVDHDSIYVVNDAKVKQECRQAGRKLPLTQFGRAMEELGVEIIEADSPQAKGRVERKHGVMQDRLVNELRLHGIKGMAGANVYLEGFLKRHNQKFSKVPSKGVNMHRRVVRGVKLEDVLCHKEIRTVGLDWCVTYGRRVLQIDRKHEGLSLARRKIEVLEGADGAMKLRYRGQVLRWQEAGDRGGKVDWSLALCGHPAGIEEAVKRASKGKGQPTEVSRPPAGMALAGRSGRTPALPYPPASKSCGRGKEAYRPAPEHPWHQPFKRRKPVPA